VTEAHQHRRGFTIVELLIVIVVIGVLAAITIVAYTGINNQARLSAIKSTLEQQAKAMELWKTQNGEVYPATLSAARAANMLDEDGGAYQIVDASYTVSPDRKNYCVSATVDPNGSGDRYSITSTSGGAPILGECVTNLIPNPSLEVNTVGSQQAGSDSGFVMTYPSDDGAQFGSRSVKVATTVVGSGWFWNVPLATSSPYVGSIYVWGSGGSVQVNGRMLYSDSSSYDWGSPSTANLGSARIRLSATQSTDPAKTLAGVYLWARSANATTPTFSVDGAMLTRGSNLYSYGDGDTPGWFWNGTPHASRSTGPAVAL